MVIDERAADAKAPPVGSDPDPEPEPEHDAGVIDQASQALFRLGRVFARRPLRDQLAGSSLDAELSAVLVVQTVQTARGAGARPTVGMIAADLGVDPSTASRLVAQTVRAGYLQRTRDVADGRSVLLGLTPRGEALAVAAARHQRAIFEELTKDWTVEERGQFAHRFVQFAAATAAMLADEDQSGAPVGSARDQTIADPGA